MVINTAWVLATVVGILATIGLTYMAAIGKERREVLRRADDDHRQRLGTVETKVAILQTTSVTEEKVRLIVHEQVAPLLEVCNDLHKDVSELQKIIIRIDAKLPELTSL